MSCLELEDIWLVVFAEKNGSFIVRPEILFYQSLQELSLTINPSFSTPRFKKLS